jgi:hypothetical protein
MNIDPLYEAARKTGGQLSFTLNVPIGGGKDGGVLGDAIPYPGDDVYVFSQDFQQVWWYGHLFRFEPNHQAVMLRAVCTAWEEGFEFVTEDQLKMMAGTKKGVRQVFAGHPALDNWFVHTKDGRGFTIRTPRR